jgi:hypothetical protein
MLPSLVRRGDGAELLKHDVERVARRLAGLAAIVEVDRVAHARLRQRPVAQPAVQAGVPPVHVARAAGPYPSTTTGYPPVQVGKNVVPLTIMTTVVACAYERVHAVCHPVIPVYP